MVVVDFLFAAEEKASAVVERAFHHAFFGVAADGADGVGPAFFVKARRVRGHGAHHVVGVGVGHRAVEAGGIEVGRGVVVDRAAEVAECVVCGLDADVGGLVAECARGQAEEGREVEASAHEVVHADAVDVDTLIHRVVAAEAEVHRAEVVRRRVVVEVVVRACECGDALRGAFLVVDNGFIEHEIFGVAVEIAVFGRGGEAYLAEVDGAVTADVDAVAVEGVAADDKVVGRVSGRYADAEVAVEIRCCRDALVAEEHRCSGDGRAGVAVHDDTYDGVGRRVLCS